MALLCIMDFAASSIFVKPDFFSISSSNILSAFLRDISAAFLAFGFGESSFLLVSLARISEGLFNAYKAVIIPHELEMLKERLVI